MKRIQAFTLVEVLSAIAIFMLLAGGIFSSMRVAFSASTQVATSQFETERSDAFQQFMQKFFQGMPADAKVELRQRKQYGGDVVEMLVWPMPSFLRFGSDPGDGIAISGLPDGRGNFRLSIGYFLADDPPEKRDAKLENGKWFMLLPDVTQIHWRLAPARNPVMTDKWGSGNGRPGIAELKLATATGGGGTFSYWIPPLQYRASGGGDDGGAPSLPPSGGPPPGTPSTGTNGGMQTTP